MTVDIEKFLEDNTDFVKLVVNMKPYSSKSIITFVDLNEGKVHILHNVYEHVKWLSNKFDWVKGELSDLEQVLDDFRYDFEMSLDPDEHPGWHVYEINADEMTWEAHHDILRRAADDHRMYRVGLFRNTFEVGPIGPNSKDREFFKELTEFFDKKIRFSK